MAIRYNETALWKRSLGAMGSDPREEKALGAIRATFETAYERVQPIIRQAHFDCKGLTIHDETHIDALWQLAGLILGSDYPLNPIEALVFGCSVLFHDSALAVSAYDGGLDSLRNTPEWHRAVLQMVGSTNFDESRLSRQQIQHYESVALFSTLRSLHAKQASLMAEREWKNPNNKGNIYIIEDTSIRDYYGQIIGRIAQSHHWDIDRVAREFSTSKAPPPNLPEDWVLNELKIACLLRCADAAHIDQRRAPLMDYILSNPVGVSAMHWNFQSRLGTPRLGDHSIVYNSGRDFGRSEADSWWLCYDTCKMVSEELQGASAILKEAGTVPFYASHVEGVQRPKFFSSFVRCDGWEPVDAEVRVTDPIHLAQTLGGRNLYGDGYQAPLRELLQNAIDATLLRSSIGREGYVPKIRLTVSKNELGQPQISVEDNGIGMSERVLTRRLLDFGRSGWKSNDVSDENPGISLSSVKISGKFGIGFFSVFLLGNEVTVTTRQFTHGVKDSLSLEFSGLTRRPILRKASEENQNDLFTTQVTVVVSNEYAASGILEAYTDKSPRRSPRFRKPMSSKRDGFIHYLRWLIASTPVEIEITDNISQKSFLHKANWAARASEEFAKDLLGQDFGFPGPDYEKHCYDSISDLYDETGCVVGRAAIALESNDEPIDHASFATVGGLTYLARTQFRLSSQRTSIVPDYVGVMKGDVNIATRDMADIDISLSTLARWATDQAKIAINSNLCLIEKFEVARSVYWAGGNSGALPIGYLDGGLATISDLEAAVSKRDSMFIPFRYSSESDSSWLSMSEAVRHFCDRACLGVFLMPLRNPDRLVKRDDEGLFASFQADVILDDARMRLLNFSHYEILFAICEQIGRKIWFKFEMRKIFEDGISINNTNVVLVVYFD